MKIERAGTFKGRFTDYGISKTKIRKDESGNEVGGLAQFACNLLATEMWDEENQVWLDWTDFNNDIDAYFVLVGNDGTPLRNAEQLMEAIGWSGKSFAELNDMDLSEVTVQFRVEEDTYKNKTSLKVNWIDKEDATPGSQIRKMDKSEINSLDSKFKSALDILGGKTAVKAPSTAPASPPKIDEPKKETPKRGRPRKGAPPTRTEPVNTNECSQEDAWKRVEETCNDGITDEQKGEAWLKATVEVAGNTSDDKITDKQWWEISGKTMAVTSIPF